MAKRTKAQWRRLVAEIERKSKAVYMEADPRFGDNISSTADMNAISKITKKWLRKMR